MLALRNRTALRLRGLLPPAVRRPLKQLVWWGQDLRRSAYSQTGEQNVARRLLAGVDARRFCVDIGAGDGRTMSNSLALFEAGWAGLSVELDGGRFAQLAKRHAAFASSTLLRGRVTPDNVIAILQAAEVPADFGFLNLDIDGYDFFVLARMLAEFRPALICAEINEKIPPPLRFTVAYDPDYSWNVSHFYGQSISQLELLCPRHGYSIVELEYNNAFLMPAEIAPRSLTATAAYREGYLDRADRRARFPWNDDMEVLHGMPPDRAVEFLRARFAAHEGRYLLDAGD